MIAIVQYNQTLEHTTKLNIIPASIDLADVASTPMFRSKWLLYFPQRKPKKENYYQHTLSAQCFFGRPGRRFKKELDNVTLSVYDQEL